MEVDLRYLGQTLGMMMLKCRRVDGVLKEVMAFAPIYKLTRLLMVERAHHQRASPDRVSFIDALRWLHTCGCEKRIRRLIINPTRPHRIDPRAIKRGHNRCPWMTKPKKTQQQRLPQHVDAA